MIIVFAADDVKEEFSAFGGNAEFSAFGGNAEHFISQIRVLKGGFPL